MPMDHRETPWDSLLAIVRELKKTLLLAACPMVWFCYYTLP